MGRELPASERLSIEMECTRLVNAYAFLVDRRRYDDQAALFAEDGVYENPFKKAEGRAAVRAYLDTRPAGVATRHACHLPFFEVVEADRATSCTYVSIFSADGTDDGPNEVKAMVGLGEFHNIFRRTAEGWRIAHHLSKMAMAVKA